MKRILSFTFFLSATLCVTAQSKTSLFDCIYGTTGTPIIRLETNWNKLINNKMEEEYVPGKIEFQCKGKPLDFEIKVRARGNMRKQVCFFPPVKVDFKSKDLFNQKIDSAIDKIKVVFQCRTGDQNSEFLIREKLCYELYKVINPDFYVLHKQVKFECMEEGSTGKVKYTLDGLIVEDESELADRMTAKVIETGKVMPAALDKDIYLRMTFFQYMIGNTDWSIPNKHNVEMIKVPGTAKVVPIAYDFDYSGLVGAPYAVPHESLPIKSIFERYYMAHGVVSEDAKKTAQYFLEKKDALIKVVDDCEGLSDKSKANIKKFLAPFFETIASEKQVIRTFTGH